MKYLFVICLFYSSTIIAQPNCEAYKYYGDTVKYQACKKAEEAGNHYQFSRLFQQKLDEAIRIDSTYAYAYREKSVAYLKSGDFITWKILIDKAVKYDPLGNLGYRGWCRYQFFRDYSGAIKDIEMLESLVDYDIGMSINGIYHLNIARAICYKAKGQREKAISIIESQLKSEGHSTGLLDYFHLGVLYLETHQLESAKLALERQIIENDFAETHYYLALTYNKLNDQSNYIKELETAKEMYKARRILSDPYSHQMDKIYLQDIENELKTAYNNL